MTQEKTDVAILGSGPAGLTAAIYTSRANRKTLVVEGNRPGGLLTTTTHVDNYPGYPQGIHGPQLMKNLKEQAIRFGTQIQPGTATQVNFTNTNQHKIIVNNNHLILANAVIIATGASSKWLGIPSEQRLLGKGVSTCATCDGYFFKNQHVAVVGGGNTALEEAIYLANICNKIYLLVRRGQFRATHIIQKQLKTKTNIEILWYTEAKEILGNDTVEGVRVVDNQTGKQREIPLQGVFIAIGHTPNTKIFPETLPHPTQETTLHLKNQQGYIQTIPGTAKTHIPGLFAAGDVADQKYRQAITSAGTGCMAALDAEDYLNQK